MKTNVQIEIGLTDARKVITMVHDWALLNNVKIKQTSSNTYFIKNVEIDTMVDCEYWDAYNNFMSVLIGADIDYEVTHL